MRLKDAPLLAAAVIGCGGVGLAGHLNNSPEIIWIFQPLTLGLIVWAAWRRGLLANHYAQFITLGLAASLLADTVRLAPEQVLISASLLLVACLSYLWAFTAECPLRPTTWPVVLAAIPAALFGVLIIPQLPVTHQIPAGFGIILGAIMLGQATVRALSLRGSHRILAFRSVLGSALLLSSMIALLINGYSQALPYAIVWEMVPYWAGQTLLALSVPERHPDTPTVG